MTRFLYQGSYNLGFLRGPGMLEVTEVTDFSWQWQYKAAIQQQHMISKRQIRKDRTFTSEPAGG